MVCPYPNASLEILTQAKDLDSGVDYIFLRRGSTEPFQTRSS
jgi:hypothetical protein